MFNKGRGRRVDRNILCETSPGRKCPQYLSDCLRNMEQNKLGRRSDAEVLNFVLGDLPAISDYFINLDLGIVCHCIYPLSDS